MILAGDIGGTHTRLALFKGGKIVKEEKKFPSKEHKSLEEIISEYLKGEKIERACFGIAGPVRNRRCKTTNLPWIVDAKNIEEKCSIASVDLLNDLEANAWGLKAIEKKDLFSLNQGEEQEGNQALISAGTGLGEAGLFWNRKEHIPFATEGGHADFAPREEREVKLFFYLKEKYGHVSYERVLSGNGLKEIFFFLKEVEKKRVSDEMQSAMKGEDLAKTISTKGKEGKDPVCKEALEMFLSIYGAEAGNQALKMLALGGVFIGGGIAPTLAETMGKGSVFWNSFLRKGRFEKVMESIPVFVIMNDNTALLGAAFFAENRR